MRLTRISQGGQVQVPAEVRRRWGTRDILIEDLGSSLSIRPLPDDPIEAAAGSLAGPGPTSDEMRRQWREEELEVERRKQARRSSTHLRSSPS
jgi:bifunctional DNA-binding transcriptional regulator/antitoxin component of YhaV-PrlF toxin-antitoxin module